MARQTGANNFAGTLEPLAGGPLDARAIVPTKADLTLSSNFPYPYIGMIVSVQAEGKVYVLTAADFTVADNWKEIGSGGGGSDNVIEGYFNPADNLFYEEDTYTTPISGETNVIYVSLDINKSYRYDRLNTIFVRLDKEDFDNPQKSSLPTASIDEVGNIYQYVGATTADYINGYFYKCVENSENPGTYKWEAVSVQAGGSGSGSLSKAITAAIDVGGIDAGDEFAVGTSYDDMWDALLNPTLYPTFTAPSASLSYSADTYYEVKSTIPAKTATESLNRGSISPAYGTSGYRSGEATNYAIATSGADTEYSDSSASSSSFSVPALTRSTKGNIVLTATISYAAGEQPKDSKGNSYDSPLPAGSKTASKTMQFIQAYFYGKSSTPTISDFTGLSKSVTAKGEKKFKYTTNNEYMVIAYDSSYGNLKTILDPNSFDVTSGWTKSTLTVDGFTYNVYVANSRTTDTDAQFTFKY